MTSTSSTSTNYSYLTTNNTSRIIGLASGMDIDSMVNSMMKAARVPLDKLEQQKQILEWQQEDYRALNSTLFEFENDAFDTKLQGTFEAKTVSSSNESVATATAGVNAAEGFHKITVNNIATGVSKESTAQLAEETDSDGNTLTLFNQFSEFASRGYNSADTISVTINGTELNFDLDQDNINTVVSKINQADLGVNASYDSDLNRFFISTASTGSDAQITVTSDSAGFLANSSNNSILKLNIDQGTSYTGQNASISIGDATNLEFASNTVTVNGITYNLKGQGDTTVQVSRDVDSIVSAITDFVDSYNTTINALYSKLQEKRNLDYSVLTDAQKEEMTDTQITSWNAKARSGLLRSDVQLQGIVNNLRSATSGFIQNNDGQYQALSQIGITTHTYTDNGKLYIDTTKLKEAIAEDPDAVETLFTNSSTTDSEKGIAVKLYETAVKGISYLSEKAGSDSAYSTVDNSYIGKSISKTNTKIKEWETKLTKIENAYYSKFSAMETLINNMTAQSSWLTTMLGSSS